MQVSAAARAAWSGLDQLAAAMMECPNAAPVESAAEGREAASPRDSGNPAGTQLRVHSHEHSRSHLKDVAGGQTLLDTALRHVALAPEDPPPLTSLSGCSEIDAPHSPHAPHIYLPHPHTPAYPHALGPSTTIHHHPYSHSHSHPQAHSQPKSQDQGYLYLQGHPQGHLQNPQGHLLASDAADQHQLLTQYHLAHQQQMLALPIAFSERLFHCKWTVPHMCIQTFDDPKFLYDHIAEDHIGYAKTGNLCLNCHWDDCIATEKKKRDHILSHVRKHVPAHREFQCPYCPERRQRKHDLNKHLHRAHGEIIQDIIAKLPYPKIKAESNRNFTPMYNLAGHQDRRQQPTEPPFHLSQMHSISTNVALHNMAAPSAESHSASESNEEGPIVAASSHKDVAAHHSPTDAPPVAFKYVSYMPGFSQEMYQPGPYSKDDVDGHGQGHPTVYHAVYSSDESQDSQPGLIGAPDHPEMTAPSSQKDMPLMTAPMSLSVPIELYQYNFHPFYPFYRDCEGWDESMLSTQESHDISSQSLSMSGQSLDMSASHDISCTSISATHHEDLNEEAFEGHIMTTEEWRQEEIVYGDELQNETETEAESELELELDLDLKLEML